MSYLYIFVGVLWSLSSLFILTIDKSAVRRAIDFLINIAIGALLIYAGTGQLCGSQ